MSKAEEEAAAKAAEEAAAKAAEEAAAKAAEEAAKADKKTKFVAVTKDGEIIKVHPGQVEQHARLGWNVVEK